MNNKEERFQIKPIPLSKEISGIVALGVAKDCVVFTLSSNFLYKVSYLDEEKGINSFKIPISSDKEEGAQCKIFPDFIGNHIFIKHYGKMFYYNIRFTTVQELPRLSKINVSSIGMDNTNTNPASIDKILIGDNRTQLYEYSLSLDKEDKIKEKLIPLCSLHKEGLMRNTKEETSQSGEFDPIYGLYVSILYSLMLYSYLDVIHSLMSWL